MLRAFVIPAALFTVRAAHAEGAGGHGDHRQRRHALDGAAGAREERGAVGAVADAGQGVVDEPEPVEVERGSDALGEPDDGLVGRPAAGEREQGVAVPATSGVRVDAPEHVERDRRRQAGQLGQDAKGQFDVGCLQRA
ncbi:MAG: hypothetical protein R3F65_15910 [bacterium]